ncbi:MAG: hypothetical protein AAFW81_02180 [Pseudomonadota bacterium]
MHKDVSGRAILFVLLAGFVIAAQSVIVAHAATYGDGPHDHHGNPCVVSVLTQAGENFTAGAAVVVIAVFAAWRRAPHQSQTQRAAIAVRAANPRGPPLR